MLLLVFADTLKPRNIRGSMSQCPKITLQIYTKQINFPESLLHVVAGCQQYVDRCQSTWRQDSILNFIAKSLQPVINVHSSPYADVNGFLNPSIINSENYRPDLLFLIQSKFLVYVLKLTVGFESNLNNNAVHKKKNI